jgi:hypothetical protein
MRGSLLLLASLCCFPAHRARPQNATRGPDDAVRALLRADSLGDWRSILRIAHPDALREFRESEVRALSSTQDDSVLMRDISQCVKEKIELANKLQLDSVYHVASATELGALPPDTVFARYRRWQARVQNVSPPDTDSSLPRRRYLGHLSPDDSTAYGIILESWDRPPMPDWPARPQLITVRRVAAEWRTMLDVDFLQGGSRVQMFDACE